MRACVRCRRLAAVLAWLLLPLLPAWAAPAQGDWAAWITPRRQAHFADPKAEDRYLRAAQEAARARGDWHQLGLLSGRLLWVIGDNLPDEAAEQVRRVEQELKRPQRQDDRLARFCLLLGLARARMNERNVPAAATLLDELDALANQAGEPAMRAEAQAMRATFLVYEGDAAKAQAAITQALQTPVDPLFELEVFAGPQVIARILSLGPDSDWQSLVADVEQRIQQLDTRRYPYMAVVLGATKATVLRRARKADRALQELRQWIDFGKRQGIDPLTNEVVNLYRGLLIDSSRWAECVQVLDNGAPAPTVAVSRASYFMAAAACHAGVKSARALTDLDELDRLLPALENSPAMVEAVLLRQAMALELLGHYREAYDKAKQARTAGLKRAAKANEAERLKLQTAFDVALKEKENTLLRSREQALEQRRQALTIGVALLVVALGLVAYLLRRQMKQGRLLEEVSSQLQTVNGYLHHANTQLHERNVSITRLVAAACHDLRQPAHALGLLVELAADKMEQAPRALEGMRRCSSTLSDMLDGLLDLSHLQAEHYRPSPAPIALGALLQEVELQFAQAAHRKGLQFTVASTPCHVISDRNLLRRMLFNLTSNAIKYTSNGLVAVDVVPDGQDVLILVSDTGPGIPEERRADAFREYTRLEPAAEAEGLGLGLSIVKRAAEVLNHRLEMTSRLHAGTRISIRVPQAQASPHGDRQPPPVRGAGRPIVIVEDVEYIRNAMAQLLTRHGFKVVACQASDELADAAPNRPALLISDLHLVSESGLHVVDRARNRPGWSDLPCLLLTGDLDPQVVIDAARAQVHVAYKPVAPQRLLELVDRLAEGVAASDIAA